MLINTVPDDRLMYNGFYLFYFYYYVHCKCIFVKHRKKNFLGPHQSSLLSSFTMTAWCCFLLLGVLFLHCCRCTGSATDLRERFLPPGFSYFALLPFIWCMHPHKLVLPRFPIGASSSFLKAAELPTVVQNTNPTDLFVWIKQCSVNI